MSSKPILSTLLAIPHYPIKDPYTMVDLDVLTNVVTSLTRKKSQEQENSDKTSNADPKDVIISALYNEKLLLEAGFNQSLSFSIMRDQLVFVFVLLMTIITAVLFIASPSDLFPRWYEIAVVIMFTNRIIDYTQKKEHFFLIDFCYTAGLQILYFLIWRSESLHLATRTYGFGAGVLGWSTVLFSNGLTVHRLDEFCSLWIHTVPALMAYSLRWTNVNSIIYYEKYNVDFSKDHMLQYYIACYAPYAIWVAGYYFIISKAFKHLTIEGDYKTLVVFIAEKSPMVSKLLDVFGPKYRVEAFMMYHVIFFTITTFIGYISFFNKTMHTVILLIWILSMIINGAKVLVKDMVRPYKMSLERINNLLTNLG